MNNELMKLAMHASKATDSLDKKKETPNRHVRITKDESNRQINYIHGNVSTEAYYNMLEKNKDKIKEFLASEDKSIIIY